MSVSQFSYSKEQFESLAQDVLRIAREKGATDAVVEVSEGCGLSVSVRKGQVETIEENRDKGIGVTVYVGQSKGGASTSDFSLKSLEDTVDAAYHIARYTAADPCAGLPEVEMLAKDAPDLHLFYPWQIDADDAISIALSTERAAMSVDKRVTNSEGANVHAQHSHFVMANSRGFMGGYPGSRHSISVAPIAGRGNHMQRDYWYSSNRNFNLLSDPEAIGRYAAERTLSRLHARRIPTQKCPVLFEAPIAAGLLGALVQATSGSSLYRKTSFLLDSLGQAIFPSHIQIDEDPFVFGGMGSSAFDDEGVQTRARSVVQNGILQGYFLSTYSARKLGLPTTGNAGGSHNLNMVSTLTPPNEDFSDMIKKMGRGLLVTELMGQGVNYVTGDYSRGASGFWVDNGEIQFPVEEITIAGNLKEMFSQIVAIGGDTLTRGNKTTGSILIESMMIAGEA